MKTYTIVVDPQDFAFETKVTNCRAAGMLQAAMLEDHSCA